MLKKSPLARHIACRFNNLRLCLPKVNSSEVCRIHVPGSIFEIDPDLVCRRPSPEKTELTRRKTKPEIRQVREVGTPFIRLLENDPR